MKNALMSLLVLGMAGCGPAMVNLVEEGTIKASALESKEVRFENLYAFEEQGQLVVAGALRRSDGLHMAYGGHVDLAVFDAEGNSMAAASSTISPKFTRRARESYFKARFKLEIPRGGKVTAAFHNPSADPDSAQFDCGENQALSGH